MSLRDHERTLYEDAWALPAYAAMSPGEQVADVFATHAKPGATVLDAGCGSGKGGVALAGHGFAVTLLDLTPDGLVLEARALPFVQSALWDDLPLTVGIRDWVYCCDVLEHLPEAFTMLAVAQMLRCANVGLFLTVAFMPDAFGVWVGAPLHQTVKPFTWWRDHLAELGHVVDARDFQHSGLFVVRHHV